MKIFENFYNSLVTAGAKFPPIDPNLLYIILVCLAVGIGIIVGLFMLLNPALKIQQQCKKISKCLAMVPVVNYENLKFFENACFDKDCPKDLKMSWFCFAKKRYGYPSQTMTKNLVFKNATRKSALFVVSYLLLFLLSSIIVAINLCALVLPEVLIFAMLIVDLVAVAIALVLFLCTVFQQKSAEKVFEKAMEELDAKLIVQQIHPYVVDTSGLEKIANELKEMSVDNKQYSIPANYDSLVDSNGDVSEISCPSFKNETVERKANPFAKNRKEKEDKKTKNDFYENVDFLKQENFDAFESEKSFADSKENFEVEKKFDEDLTSSQNLEFAEPEKTMSTIFVEALKQGKQEIVEETNLQEENVREEENSNDILIDEKQEDAFKENIDFVQEDNSSIEDFENETILNENIEQNIENSNLDNEEDALQEDCVSTENSNEKQNEEANENLKDKFEVDVETTNDDQTNSENFATCDNDEDNVEFELENVDENIIDDELVDENRFETKPINTEKSFFDEEEVDNSIKLQDDDLVVRSKKRKKTK